MSFEKITRQYLKAYQASTEAALSAGAKSNEMATRPVVHNFIMQLVDLCRCGSDEVVVHHDTNYTRTERPDWRFEDSTNFGIYCFGDHKRLETKGPFEPTKLEQSQIQRYLDLGRPVFIFDGIEFVVYEGPIVSPSRFQLVSKPLALAKPWEKLPIDSGIETKFRQLLRNPGFRKWTETQLMEQLATRARFASDEIAMLLSAPIGSGISNDEELLIKSLSDLKNLVSNHHDATLRDDRSCADFISQVLTFGLFYAHATRGIEDKSPFEKKQALKAFWDPQTFGTHKGLLRPFKAITDTLSSSLTSPNFLSEWYEEVMNVLAHAEFMGAEPDKRDFHTLFEVFLTAFDPKTRFDRGVFYTPKPLTDWMALFVDKLSIKHFGKPVMDEAEKIIDPCCGTGGFLEAIYSANPNYGLHPPTLIGFEVLPAPYALAHYRLAEVFKGKSVLPQLKVLLTDTLSDQLALQPTEAKDEFEHELNDARSLSLPPLRLVIGNPPSANRSVISDERSLIDKAMNDFRPPRLERTDRQNIQKALNNEAYRFLRWCAGKAIESGRGILALVLPGAFARSVSFVYARKWICENFQNIYVLEIDEDARAGNSTKSIFPVMQGRLVLVAIKTEARADDVARVLHSDISSFTLEDKNSFLSDEPDINKFSCIDAESFDWKFAPSAFYPKTLWENSWPLTSTQRHQGIFISKCSGIKLAPTAMLFHTQQPTLIRRSNDLSSNRVDDQLLIDKWFTGQQKKPRKEKLTPKVKAALKIAATESKVARYLFRPFVYGSVLLSEELFEALSQAEGGGLRSRPEVRAAFAGGAIGLAVSPAPRDLGQTLTRFACFSWDLPDNDIAARGNAMVYSDYYPDPTHPEDPMLKSNINTQLLSYFSFSEHPSHAVLFYLYAVMSSQSYLDAFEGALYVTSNPNSPHRIPVASDDVVRVRLANLGEQLANCEREDFVSQQEDKISVSWPDNFSGAQLKTYEYQDSTSSLLLKSESSTFASLLNVPSSAFETRIAGHAVVEKWLRERCFQYLRRDFSLADAQELKGLIGKISLQNSLLTEQIDPLVSEMLSTGSLINPVSATNLNTSKSQRL